MLPIPEIESDDHHGKLCYGEGWFFYLIALNGCYE